MNLAPSSAMIKRVGRRTPSAVALRDLPTLLALHGPGSTNDYVVDMCIVDSLYREDFAAIDARQRLMGDVKHRYQSKIISDDLLCSEGRDHGSMIIFNHVAEHRDPGFHLYRPTTPHHGPTEEGPPSRAATLSIVLAGAGTFFLNDGDERRCIALKVGDVYVFDQEITHSFVQSAGTSVHLTTSILYDVAVDIPTTDSEPPKCVH